MLAWTDLVESIAWLLIVFITELSVRYKTSATGNSAVLTWLERLKGALYILIVAIALYWGSKQQYLYL